MKITGAQRESGLMQVLSEHGTSTVAEIQDDNPACTTHLRVPQNLKKGYVGHVSAGTVAPVHGRDQSPSSAAPPRHSLSCSRRCFMSQ